jgi:hypothetical protein
VRNLAIEILEKIRRSVQSSPQTQPPQLVAKVLQQAVSAPQLPAVEDAWNRLADLLALDRGYVRRVCEASPDWCIWLYSTIMSIPMQIPGTAPTADVLTLIEQASRRGYRNIVQKLDIKELAKTVAEYVEKRVKEFGRPVAEARQNVEQVLKMVRDVYGSRAQPAIEEEVFKRIRNIAQENIARDIAKAVARASVELPPTQAVEKIEQLATAVRRIQVEVKEKPPALKQAVQSPEQAKPLRPSATVKQV